MTNPEFDREIAKAMGVPAKEYAEVRVFNPPKRWPWFSLHVSFPCLKRPRPQLGDETPTPTELLIARHGAEDFEHNRKVLAQIPETPQAARADTLTDTVRKWGRPGMAAKFLSERCIQILGMRGYNLVKDPETGEPIREPGGMLLAEIPEAMAKARQLYWGVEANNAALCDVMQPTDRTIWMNDAETNDWIRAKLELRRWRGIIAIFGTRKRFTIEWATEKPGCSIHSRAARWEWK